MDKFCNFLNSLKGNGPRGHCSNATRLDGCGPCSGLSESRNLLNSCDSFRIIQEINEAYEKRLRTYECAENETELKVNTMQLWINDLREQNELLLDIVEKLEKEAMDKQKLGCDMEKNYSKELEKYQQMMCCKDRIIETQQHALEDLKTSVCNNQTQGKCTACRNVNRSANGNIPPECAKCFKSKEKDRLSCIPEDLSRSSENLFRQACSVIEDKPSLNGIEDKEEIEFYRRKRLQDSKIKKSEEEIEEMRKLLSENASKIAKMNQKIISCEKRSIEMRDTLLSELADKCKEVLELRRSTHRLEKRMEKLDLQLNCNSTDDIIKGIRVETKLSNNKYS